MQHKYGVKNLLLFVPKDLFFCRVHIFSWLSPVFGKVMPQAHTPAGERGGAVSCGDVLVWNLLPFNPFSVFLRLFYRKKRLSGFEQIFSHRFCLRLLLCRRLVFPVEGGSEVVGKCLSWNPSPGVRGQICQGGNSCHPKYVLSGVYGTRPVGHHPDPLPAEGELESQQPCDDGVISAVCTRIKRGFLPRESEHTGPSPISPCS